MGDGVVVELAVVGNLGFEREGGMWVKVMEEKRRRGLWWRMKCPSC
jgi:hypothetical protein